MVRQKADTLSNLYLDDETAWLESMAELLRAGAYAELDLPNLREYLTDMAQRDRREVESRLIVLLLHILKWAYQSDNRSRSWQGSILEQQQGLRRLAGSGVLRAHAESVLADVYRDAVDRAIIETGLSADAFPAECGYTVDEVLAFDPTSNS